MDASYYVAAQQVVDFWVSKGFTLQQAYGFLANACAESSLNPKARGDYDKALDIYKAHGLHQLHNDRCLLIRDGGQGYKGCGIDILLYPDIPTQLAAIWWELQHSERHALGLIKQTKTAYDAGWTICHYYERPGAPGQAEKRGKASLEWETWFANRSIK
jgi:hypothetical protein